MLENIKQQVGTFLPGILTAIAVLIIGWIVAKIIAMLVGKALKKTGAGAKTQQARFIRWQRGREQIDQQSSLLLADVVCTHYVFQRFGFAAGHRTTARVS